MGIVESQRASNRTIYAKVRLPAGVLAEHRDSAFKEHGWHWSKVGEGYIIAMPLYCARPVALSVARGEILNFSQRHFPLEVDDLRLFSPPSDSRLRAQVRRTAGGWVDLWPKRIRENKDLPIGAMHWEVAVPRSDAKSLGDRRSDHEMRARLAAGVSELPGEKFDLRKMAIYTSAEPARVVPELGAAPWKSLGFLALLVLFLLVILGGSSLVWSPVPLWTRLLGGGTAAGCLIVGGMWSTANRRSWLVRLGVIALLLVFGALLGVFGALLATKIKFVVVALPAALAVCGVYFGWVHLSALHRGVRVLWSIPVLSVTAAVSAVLGRSAVAIWLGALGVPSERIAVPGWFQFLAAAAVAISILGVAVVLGALCGWARYYGAGAGGLMAKAQAFLGVLLIALLWGLSTFAALGSLLGGVASGWESNLVDGRTPMFTSEFLYSGCLVEPDGVVEQVVVLEGSGAERWTMTVEEGEDGARTLGQATPVRSGDVDLVRTGSEDGRCKG
ncbi:hypothetical protein ACTXKL_13860 [Brachybacterium tyrofermentans]|uniref:hypothetical protein n=1 Tax=Brachybacterium tyrofermentans TaxID=47848 RepID=UPI003FCEF31D